MWAPLPILQLNGDLYDRQQSISRGGDVSGGFQTILKRQSFIPFALPSVGEDELGEVADTLKSGWLSTGPKVRQFEADVAEYLGASQAVAVSSCTAGLHLSLKAFGIGAGDEVIVPTMTFCATANVVEHVGAKPILVDCGADGNIDAEAAESLITDRTKALIPVHFGGQAVDLDAVHDLARRHDLIVIEDAAHAIGASYKGAMIGADLVDSAERPLRRTVVFSFYATKNLATGEGGMVVTDDEDVASSIRLLSLHGMSRDAWKRYTSTGSWFYEVVEPGFKANMTDIQAALGIHQLRRLNSFNQERQRQADAYDKMFASSPAITVPPRKSDRDHVFHLYVIRLNLEAISIDRGEFIDELREYNIGTSVHFIPIHVHPYYREKYGYTRDQFPVASEIFDECISLPIYPGLSTDDVDYVGGTVQFLIEKFS